MLSTIFEVKIIYSPKLKLNMRYGKCAIVCILILLSTVMFAQESGRLRPRPTALVSAKYKDTYIKITYCQPQRKGREIFGILVPYGEVWRTGANEATEITLTRNVLINGNLLEAGTYSLFTIPDQEKWTIILNKDVGLWGSYNYNPKVDVMRFERPVQSTDGKVFDAFTIQFDQKNSTADILLIWDQTIVSIPIQFIEPKQP
jgi:hypothetical protein